MALLQLGSRYLQVLWPPKKRVGVAAPAPAHLLAIVKRAQKSKGGARRAERGQRTHDRGLDTQHTHTHTYTGRLLRPLRIVHALAPLAAGGWPRAPPPLPAPVAGVDDGRQAMPGPCVTKGPSFAQARELNCTHNTADLPTTEFHCLTVRSSPAVLRCERCIAWWVH